MVAAAFLLWTIRWVICDLGIYLPYTHVSAPPAADSAVFDVRVNANGGLFPAVLILFYRYSTSPVSFQWNACRRLRAPARFFVPPVSSTLVLCVLYACVPVCLLTSRFVHSSGPAFCPLHYRYAVRAFISLLAQRRGLDH